MSRKKLLESEVELLYSIRRGLDAIYSHHRNDKIDTPSNGTVGYHLLDCITHLDIILYDNRDF